MPDNLDQVVRCVSHVSTRLRFVQRSTVTSGSPIEVEILDTYYSQSKYVIDVPIKTNVPSGASQMKDSESGVDSLN